MLVEPTSAHPVERIAVVHELLEGVGGGTLGFVTIGEASTTSVDDMLAFDGGSDESRLEAGFVMAGAACEASAEVAEVVDVATPKSDDRAGAASEPGCALLEASSSSGEGG